MRNYIIYLRLMFRAFKDVRYNMRLWKRAYPKSKFIPRLVTSMRLTSKRLDEFPEDFTKGLKFK